MSTTHILVEKLGQLVPGKRLYLGEAGKSEAWLRDTLFNHPNAVPINEIDASFGPLLPLPRDNQGECPRQSG